MASKTARRLRQDMTEAERALWRLLRSRQLSGFKFRRQPPIDQYIVDFICFSRHLVIEVDDGQHASPDRPELQGTQHLHRSDFRILRFWNNEVLQNAKAYAKRSSKCEGAPTPVSAASNAST